MQSIKIKNCLVSPSKIPRFDAAVGDRVYYRDEKGQITEGLIRAISGDGETVSLSHGEVEARQVSTDSIIALLLNS